MIQTWWQNLEVRDQRILKVGVFCTILVLVWAFLWHPLMLARRELNQRIIEGREHLLYAQRAAVEIERLRTTGARARADRQGKSLLALADATARGAGLADALKRVEPVNEKNVRVNFEQAPFDTLIRWLEDLARDYGVQARDLSADRAQGVGTINARITLEDTP